MKKIIIFGIFIALLGAAMLLDDNMWHDFVHYDKKYNLEKELSGNVYVIGDIENELYEIARKYDEGLTLAYAEYEFIDSTNTIAEFYFRTYGNNRNTVLCLTMDVANKCVFSAYVCKRHNNALAFDHPLENNKEIDIYEEYKKIINNLSKYDGDGILIYPVRITVTTEKIFKTCKEIEDVQ